MPYEKLKSLLGVVACQRQRVDFAQLEMQAPVMSDYEAKRWLPSARRTVRGREQRGGVLRPKPDVVSLN